MPEVILIVDDDPDVARAIEVTLAGEGFETILASSGADALAVAQRVQPDLILLDVMMPGVDGVEVCKQLRSSPTTSATSIIMLTARSMPSDRVVGLTAGADDYIAKPFDIDELVARVKSTLRRSAQLRGISPLTGLPGNFGIEAEIEALLDAGADFAVLHADVDDFKAYNDYYGFMQGDRAIQATAKVLADVMSETGGRHQFLGHVGGDDFVLICDAELASTLAETVIRVFDQQASSLYEPEDQLNGYIEVEDRMGMTHRYPFLSLSIGVADTSNRRYSGPAEMASVASEMKHLAKTDRGSSWRIDRRRD